MAANSLAPPPALRSPGRRRMVACSCCTSQRAATKVAEQPDGAFGASEGAMRFAAVTESVTWPQVVFLRKKLAALNTTAKAPSSSSLPRSSDAAALQLPPPVVGHPNADSDSEQPPSMSGLSWPRAAVDAADGSSIASRPAPLTPVVFSSPDPRESPVSTYSTADEGLLEPHEAATGGNTAGCSLGHYLNWRIHWLSKFRCLAGCPVDLIALLVAPFLQISEVVRVSQLCQRNTNRTFAIRSLSLSQFRYFPNDVLAHTARKLLLLFKPKACHRIDLSYCAALKDSTLAIILAHQDHPPSSVRLPSGSNAAAATKAGASPNLSPAVPLNLPNHYVNLRELNADFCHLLTDKSLERILAANLPHLERLSFRGARNSEFVGGPFSVEGTLCGERLPRLQFIDCSFTCFELPHLLRVVPFLKVRRQAALSGAGRVQEVPSAPEAARHVEASEVIRLMGARACLAIVKKMGLSTEYKNFCRAMRKESLEAVQKSVTEFEMQWDGVHVEEQAEITIKQALPDIVAFLANLPCPVSDSETHSSDLPSCNAAQRTVPVWTNPLLIAIRRHDVSIFRYLVDTCRADLAMWGYESEMPLAVACGTRVARSQAVSVDLSVADLSTVSSQLHASPLFPSPPVSAPPTPRAPPSPPQQDASTTVQSRQQTAALSDSSHTLYSLMESPMAEIINDLCRRSGTVDGCLADDTKRWPLCVAAARGDAMLIRHLLSHGAKVNISKPYLARPSTPRAPQPSDATAHSADGSQTLQESACASVVKIRKSSPALVHAIDSGSVECVKLLIDAGADTIDSVVMDQGSGAKIIPLKHCYKKLPEAMDLLIQSGVSSDPAALGHALGEVMAAAIQAGDSAGVKKYARKFPELLKQEHPIHSTPLHQAAYLGQYSMISVLVEAGADNNAISSAGETPLMRATQQGKWMAVKELLAEGANIDTRSLKTGMTPLHIASEESQLEVMEVLIQGGADRNLGDRKDNPPLMTALLGRREDAAMMLLKSDAGGESAVDLDHYTQNYGTALMTAILLGLFTAAHRLVDLGARCDVVDDQGVSIVEAAERKINSLAQDCGMTYEEDEDLEEEPPPMAAQRSAGGQSTPQRPPKSASGGVPSTNASPSQSPSPSHKHFSRFRQKLKSLLGSSKLPPRVEEVKAEGDEGDENAMAHCAEELMHAVALRDKILHRLEEKQRLSAPNENASQSEKLTAKVKEEVPPPPEEEDEKLR